MAACTKKQQTKVLDIINMYGFTKIHLYKKLNIFQFYFQFVDFLTTVPA